MFICVAPHLPRIFKQTHALGALIIVFAKSSVVFVYKDLLDLLEKHKIGGGCLQSPLGFASKALNWAGGGMGGPGVSAKPSWFCLKLKSIKLGWRGDGGGVCKALLGLLEKH